jgi:hypothetical protein
VVPRIGGVLVIGYVHDVSIERETWWEMEETQEGHEGSEVMSILVDAKIWGSGSSETRQKFIS